MEDNVLKFTQFHSAVDAAFWQSLVSKKLDDLKLSKDSQTIQGYFTFGQSAIDEQGNKINIPSRFQIPAEGLDLDKNLKIGYNAKGILVNTNTIEEFRSIDKSQLFQQITDKINADIQSNKVLDDPSLLSQFLLLTFADLKKYKFYYWFAFPAFIPKPSVWITKQIQPVQSYLSPTQCNILLNQYPLVTDSNNPYFLFKKNGDDQLQLEKFNQLEKITFNEGWVLGFMDPSTSQDALGWPIRNALYFIHSKYNISSLKILCFKGDIASSLVVDTELPSTSNYSEGKAVGWERNAQGKLGPRLADLGPLMDPARLADTSVDLNLKLMRWRLLPDLDLEKIKGTKCLLLGAGTLGCYVARCLIGWGVRHITFVDNGKVSFSNPVRQPLYQFTDSLQGGLPKAETAAKNLQLIQPTMVTKGYDISIPMPGHPSTSDDKLSNDIQQLEALIQEHDVIYLLTDSRESRWYPTLLGSLYNKVVINSALGFDTYVVMRHGSRQQEQQAQSLGCYFCNDIVAPTDSLTDRTLDQQCTVTRPGLAAIAGALSVELMVSLIQHPDGINAKADTSNQSGSSILGLLPHQIRGFLGQFSNMLIVGQAYEKCTACSQKILDAYKDDKLEFMKKALKDPTFLEELTGLLELKQQSEDLLFDIESGDEDDF